MRRQARIEAAERGVRGARSASSGRWTRMMFAVALASGLGACGDSAGGADTSAPADTTADTSADLGDTAPIEFDTAAHDATIDTSAPDANPGGDFGTPCVGNGDCTSGWCVEGPSGYVCTKECLEECPGGFDCKSVQNSKGDVTFLCLPRVQKLCTPCLEDFQCNGGACLEIDGAKQCASGCDEEADCPDGYTCAADAAGERDGTFCQPKSGSCECSQPYEGVARTCSRSNGVGTCLGVETCDPDVGWVGCSARDAGAESCDYVDNDCDGDVDEDFKVDGIYASAESCGSCTTACDDVLANAAETACVVEGGVARCQVVSCEPGFSPINPFVCAPDAGNSCQPCTSAAECLGNGAACSELDDGLFCTRACTRDEDCADGFACKQTPNGKQCLPTSGSCTCDGSNTDLARSCSVTYTPPDPNDPAVTCRGLERCTTDGWGECELPSESCDGVDNDCDGVIDGPFKTGAKYTALEHCGACGISCLALARPNATPICDAAAVVPTCGYRCTGAAVDVNGRSDDGCECVPVAGPDLAGDDVDSNCDGVDGEVDNAVFVSKDGDDANPGTLELPVATVQVGIDKAAAAGKRDVYVATGVYSGSIALANGVGVFGGYAPGFDEHDALLYETALIGGAPEASRPGTVNANNVGAADAARDTVLDGFTVFGVNAANTVGLSSYAIYINNGGPRLRVSKNRVFAGPGGVGQAGARGADGAAGVNGSPGLVAKNLGNNCGTANESAGGAGGARTCGGVDVGGGAGGRAACPVFESSPPSAAKGVNGKGTSPGSGGAFGWPLFICATSDSAFFYGCDPYPYGCGTCYLPADQKPFSPGNGGGGGKGTAGAAGSGVTAGAGAVSGGLWVGAAGGTGGAGTHGSGGGGGGAGGGVEVDGSECNTTGNDDVSGSGGGGGSGGCGATGGTGGSSGGGSFGIFVIGNGLPTLTGNTIMGGRGGAGGNGGPGGVGGAAGQGAAGGGPGDSVGNQNVQCAEGGGAGGNGGEGGHGGGGGGGAGGPSYGIYAAVAGAPASWKTGNTFLPGAQGGTGGQGGVSLDPSKSGGNGQAGAAGNANF